MRASAAFRTSVVPGGGLVGPWARDALWAAARAVPSLDLRFAEQKSLVDATTGANLVTFTRASSGTYVDSQGVIRTATTNLLLQSEDFSTTWTNTNSTEATNVAVAPNGTSTADELIVDGSNGTHSIQSNAVTSSSGSVSTFSCYIKASTSSFAFIALTDRTTGAVERRINLSTGAIDTTNIGAIGSWTSTSATVSNIGNGWYRVSVTGTQGAGTTVAGQVFVGSQAGLRTYLGNSTDSIYVWGAQLEQSSSVGEYIPTGATINSAPRFDHNPTTGESLGLLVEEARTNSIRNNTMVGAVAGTPGTLPTNWVFLAGTTGIASEVVGTGLVNGINYIDIRYSGTAASTSSFSQRFEGAAVAAALTGQTWAMSTWTKIQAGSTAGITAISHQYVENTSGGSFVTSGTVALTVDSSFTRHTSSRTLSGGATVAFITGGISVTVTSGATIDITLRIGLPQLEQGAFATSIIPTTGTAATRSADVASISGSNFSSWYRQDEGTLFCGTSNAFGIQYYADTGSGINNSFYADTSGGNRRRGVVFQGGNIQAASEFGVIGSSLQSRTAFALKSDDFGFCENGGTVVVDSSGLLASGVQRISIGNNFSSNASVNGRISRLTYWPQRLANSTLQTITQQPH